MLSIEQERGHLASHGVARLPFRALEQDAAAADRAAVLGTFPEVPGTFPGGQRCQALSQGCQALSQGCQALSQSARHFPRTSQGLTAGPTYRNLRVRDGNVTEGEQWPTIEELDHAATYLADLLLVDRCREGEEAAATELFRSQHKRVHATLYRVLGSSRDMEDLLQETFIQVFKSLHTYRGDAKLATWIDRIAARVAYRYLSAKKRTPPTLSLVTELGPTSPPPLAQVAARTGVARLYGALDSLSPKLRIAFALFEIDGRPMEQVAELLDCAQTTAKVRVWRARRALFKKAGSDPVLSELLTDEKATV